MSTIPASSKPVVSVKDVTVYNTGGGARFVGVMGVGHPNFNEGVKVTSSKIVSIDVDGGTIETLNTVYKVEGEIAFGTPAT